MGLPCGTLNTSYQKDVAIVRTKTQWVLLILAIAFLFSLGFYLPTGWVLTLRNLGIYVVAVLGLHILLGLCGQFSMGHAAFMAVGAYTAAILGSRYGLPAWGTFPIAGILAGTVGLVFGMPALRIKGFYLVMSTIAAQFIIIFLLRDSPLNDFTKGHSGYAVPGIAPFGHQLGDVGYLWLTMIVVLAMLFIAKNFHRTATGRKFIAVRDNDLAAEVMGINLFRTKLLAFFVGCFFAGIAGWLLAYSEQFAHPDTFSFALSLKFLGMIIIGGMGSTAGAVLGVTAFSLVDKFTTDWINPWMEEAFPSLAANVGHAMTLIVFAVLVIFFILVEPRGLFHRFHRLRLYYRLHPFSY
jgi:branched-chain amino acid transport system permease protein